MYKQIVKLTLFKVRCKQCSVKGCPSSAKNGVRLHRYQAVFFFSVFVPDVNDFNPDQNYEKI